MLDNESIGIVSAWNATHTKIFRLSSQPSQETAITEKKVRILVELLGARKYSSASEPDGDDHFPPKFRKFLLESIDPTQLSPEAREEYNRMRLMVHDLEVLPTDITRWKIALNFAEIIAGKIDKSNYSALREALVRRCGDWPQTQGAFQDIRIVAGFTAAALVYGGLHALAWFIHFPSSTEQLLWRTAVCVVMAGLPVTAIFISIWRSSQIPRSVLEMIVQRNRRLHVWLMLVFFMMGALYAVARAYLVVECFINVAHLPPGVYQVPNWAAYFSHVA